MKKLFGCLTTLVALALLGFIAIVLVAMLGSMQTPMQTKTEIEPPSRESESIDLFTPAGDTNDLSLTIHCYRLARVATAEEIVSQAKTLANTYNHGKGKEVAYIFNANAKQEMIQEFILTRAGNGQFSDQLRKWMHDNHFAMISYMNGTHWELFQQNDVAKRTFNNKMESIRLSQ
jgi:hypothetical protein